MLTVGSLFSGIGGFDEALTRVGMRVLWQVEIDPACRRVLAGHFPEAVIHEDVRNVGSGNLAAVDVLVGGFPCQDLSVAGKRAGLAGERSGLWFEFERLVSELRPGWVVIENVPGLLSSNGGRDFAVILRGLVERGYGVAWRILDAQYFGLAQRRRRVFIVASLGSGRCAQILFESEGGGWDTPSRRTPGQGIAATIEPGACTPSGDVTHALRSEGADASEDGTGRGTPLVVDALTSHNGGADVKHAQAHQLVTAFNWQASPASGLSVSGEVSPTMRVGQTPAVFGPPMAFTERTRDGERNFEAQEELAYALTNPGSGGRTHSRQIAGGFGVRRLTPVECERLQGLPRGWTAGFADSTRYRMIGNAIAVPVAEWIGRRIVEASA